MPMIRPWTPNKMTTKLTTRTLAHIGCRRTYMPTRMPKIPRASFEPQAERSMNIPTSEKIPSMSRKAPTKVTSTTVVIPGEPRRKIPRMRDAMARSHTIHQRLATSFSAISATAVFPPYRIIPIPSTLPRD